MGSAEGQDRSSVGPALGMYLSLDVCGFILSLHLFEYYGNKSNLDCDSVVLQICLKSTPEAGDGSGADNTAPIPC